MRLGTPELFIILLIGVFYLIPIAAAIWALVTLYRIRETQEVMHPKLDLLYFTGLGFAFVR
jgi:hypothetical protein